MNPPHAPKILVIFAREPKVGKVKTRLLADFSAAAVTELYTAFLKDTLIAAKRAGCRERWIFYAGSARSIPFLRQYSSAFYVKRQHGRDLGQRMNFAFQSSFLRHSGPVVVIGSDCPELQASEIDQAFQELTRFDCVLGPSRDGGYYLIGLARPFPEIFRNIKWSSPAVLRQTLKKAAKHKRKIFLLRKREDIDTAADLKKLAKRIDQLPDGSYTKKQLKRLSHQLR